MKVVEDLLSKIDNILVNSAKIGKKRYFLENTIVVILRDLNDCYKLYDEIPSDDLKIMIDDLRLKLRNALHEDTNSLSSIVMEIRPGVGGDEAALFAMDLFKMYMKVCEKNKFKVEIIEMKESVGELEFANFKIDGKDCSNVFKYESGVHRVQRVPQTEAKGRIHTSTASVTILEDLINIQINILPKDLLIETCRASGAGGQHVNKTESAVRIVHIPTGLAVECQDERSQHDNKERAMKTLKMRLYQMELQKYYKQRDLERKSQVSGAKRSDKSRTYNCKDNRVTDHMFGITVYCLDKIMAGDINILTDKMRVAEEESYDVLVELNEMLNNFM